MVYGTGFGLMQSPLNDGQTVSDPVSLMLPVTATIGGVPADVIYAGTAPALVAGVTQINIRIPQGLPSNPFTSLTLSLRQVTTPPGTIVSIR
jgi:trimeric autotransporter adhesin